MKTLAKLGPQKQALLVVCFCDSVSGGILFPLLPFRFQDLGATPLEISILLAMTPVASAFIAPLIGVWSDRVGRFLPLVAAAAMSSVTFAAYAFAAQIWEVALIRFFGSLCNTTVALCHASACDLSPDRESRSDLFRYLSATTPAGFIVGPLLASAVEPLGSSAPFLLGSLIALVPVGVCVLFLRPTKERPREIRRDQPSAPAVSIWAIGRAICTSPPILLILGIIVVGTVARTCWSTTGGLFLTEAAPDKLSHEDFSVFIAATAVVELLAVIYLFPILRRHVLDVGAVALGAIGFTVGLAVLMRSQDVVSVAIAVLGIGAGLSFLRPATRNVLAEHAQPGSYGTLMAFSEASAFGSRTIATVLSGVIFSWGALWPLALSAAGHLLIIILIAAAFSTGLIAFRRATTELKEN